MRKEVETILNLRGLDNKLKNTCKEVQCSNYDYHMVVVPAANHLGFNHALFLEEQLGIWLNIHFNYDDIKLSCEWCDLFEKLAGPYGEIVLKAYQKKRAA